MRRKPTTLMLISGLCKSGKHSSQAAQEPWLSAAIPAALLSSWGMIKHLGAVHA